jgi:hypothetical protein
LFSLIKFYLKSLFLNKETKNSVEALAKEAREKQDKIFEGN